jgi:hypothetical protein
MQQGSSDTDGCHHGLGDGCKPAASFACDLETGCAGQRRTVGYRRHIQIEALQREGPTAAYVDYLCPLSVCPLCVSLCTRREDRLFESKLNSEAPGESGND